MLARLPMRRYVRRLSLLTIAVALIALLPSLYRPAQASINTRILDDTQADFSKGNFQRTAISSGPSPTLPEFLNNDADGYIQLAAVGSLKPWTRAAQTLPEPLSSFGVTTIRNRLYTVAGAVDSQVKSISDAVYWTKVDQTNGTFLNHGFTEATKPVSSTITNPLWVNDPLTSVRAFMNSAPATAPPSCATENIQGRRAPAVASLTTDSGTDYIYSIGGAFQPNSACSSNPITSPVVQIGSVTATTGDIAWSSNPDNYLPSPDVRVFDTLTVGTGAYAFGVAGATATIMHTRNGDAYLYVIGGMISNVYVTLNTSNGSMITPAVFYTRVNTTTGALQHPTDTTSLTPWARTVDVPVPGTDTGIFNHTAMVSRATVDTSTGGTTSQEAIYVTGGYTKYAGNVSTAANAAVYRATADEATGAITWVTALNPPIDTNVSMDIPRGESAGFAYGSKLYIIGGRPNYTGAPLATISTGVHDDNLNMLPLFGSATPEYFTGGVGAADVIASADAVYGLSAAVIPSLPAQGATKPANAAWGYALGGNTTASGSLTSQIYFGGIGGENETASATRAPEGWYYSQVHDIRIKLSNDTEDKAKVLAFIWNAQVDRTLGKNPTADLHIEFRRTENLPCNDTAFYGPNTEWQSLDGDSTTSFYSLGGIQTNRFDFTKAFATSPPTATCFQYRVFMTQNGSNAGMPITPGDRSVTPKLFKVALETSEAFDADLQINAFEIGPNAQGQIETFSLKIMNLNGVPLYTALPNSDFPVVLCVAYSATDPNVALTVPTLPAKPLSTSNPRLECAPVWRNIPKAWAKPSEVLWLNSDIGWQTNRDNVDPGAPKTDDPINVLKAFNTPGYYAVAAIIDPFGLVPEGGGGKANNCGENLNGGQPLIRRFQIKAIKPDTAFPAPVTLPQTPDIPPTPTPTPTGTGTGTPTPTPTGTGTGTPTPPVDNSVYLPMVVR